MAQVLHYAPYVVVGLVVAVAPIVWLIVRGRRNAGTGSQLNLGRPARSSKTKAA